jgi:hypothetical protein
MRPYWCRDGAIPAAEVQLLPSQSRNPGNACAPSRSRGLERTMPIRTKANMHQTARRLEIVARDAGDARSWTAGLNSREVIRVGVRSSETS